MMSATTPCAVQSPPPMTFPARAVASAIPCRSISLGREERVAIRGGDEFGSRLAGTVGIFPAERVVLDEPTPGLVVRIALVARDDEDGTRQADLPDRIEEDRGSEDVDRERLRGIFVAGEDDALGGEVEHNLGLAVADRALQPGSVADVGAVVRCECVGDARGDEVARRGRRIQRIAGHVRAQLVKPEGEPGSLEARVTGDHHGASAKPGQVALQVRGRGFHSTRTALVVESGHADIVRRRMSAAARHRAAPPILSCWHAGGDCKQRGRAPATVECRSCAARAGVLLLDLGPQPDPDMLLDPEGRRQAPTAPVRAWICASCGLVQLVGSRPAGPPGVHGHSAGPSEGRRDPWWAAFDARVPSDDRLVVDIDVADPGIGDGFIAAGFPVVGYAAAAAASMADVTGFAASGSILPRLRRSWSRADRRAW